MSIHADSLHPALRGTMAYIPGADYVTGSYEKSGGVYLARAEVREAPAVRHTEKESLTAEGLSRDLAESIVDAIESKGLQVHAFNPVRDNVVRNGREWVPAVIRYNLASLYSLKGEKYVAGHAGNLLASRRYLSRHRPKGPRPAPSSAETRPKRSNQNDARRAVAIGARSARTQGAPIALLSARLRTRRCARIARRRDTAARCGLTS